MSLAPEHDLMAARSLLASSRPRPSLPISFETIPPLVAAFDIAWVLLLGVGTGLAYHLIVLDSDYTRSYLGASLAVAALFSAMAQAAGLYRPANLLRTWSQVRRMVFIWMAVFGCLVAIAFLLKIGAMFSRVTVLLFFAGGICAIGVSRPVIARTLAHVISVGALAGRRIAVVGVASEIASNELLAAVERYGYEVARVFLLSDSNAGSDEAERVVAQRLNEVVDYARSSRLDEIVLAIPWAFTELIERAEAALQVLPIPVKLVPDTIASRFFARPLFEFGPTKAIELQRPPLTAAQRVVKKSLDLCLAALGLFLLMPMLVVLALAIRLESPGPALFLQARIGFNGRPFRIFKFRTMTTLEDGGAVVQARRNDPRVTPLGRLLRGHSIDELPQLLNVLRGEMSLIGPRPHAVSHDDEYGRLIATYAMRRKMKPGLTGWAQVNGCRGETPTVGLMQRRIDHDLWYIEYWSIWLDIRILLATVVQLLAPRNVY
jgi:Undecaprenyl-phosphate glucose phosphotransferase